MIFLVMVVSQKSQAFQPDPRTPTIGLLSGEFTRPAGGETAFPHAIFGVRTGLTDELRGAPTPLNRFRFVGATIHLRQLSQALQHLACQLPVRQPPAPIPFALSGEVHSR